MGSVGELPTKGMYKCTPKKTFFLGEKVIIVIGDDKVEMLLGNIKQGVSLLRW